MWTQVILLSLLSLSSIAALPELLFENVNGEYTAGKGRAHVMEAKYKIDSVELAHTDIEVTFNRAEKNLVLRGPSTVVHFGFDFSFLNIFRVLNFNGVEVKLREKEFVTTASSLYTQVGKFDYNITNLSLGAEILNMSDPNRVDQILDSFILNGSLSVDKISYTPVSLNQFKTELVENNVNLKKVSLNKALVRASLKWAKLKVKKGKISGSILIDSWVNAWLRVQGKIVNKKKSKILQIELTKAKLGYFRVTKFVLKALKKLESDKITVEGNIIKISIM